MLGAVTRPRFLAVGDLMLDVLVRGRGHEAQARVVPGGSAALAAAWAAGSGAEATVVGRVGDDLAGRALREALVRAGVVPWISVDEKAPTGTFALVGGEVYASPGANARLLPECLPKLLGADAVLVSGYLPAETVAAALARAKGPWIALSPGPLLDLPRGANALLVDEEEARRLTGAGPLEAAHLLGQRFRLAAVTRGALGAVVVLDGTVREREGRARESASPVGAGDAFAAGLLVALARGADLDEALDLACRLGEKAALVGSWPSG